MAPDDLYSFMCSDEGQNLRRQTELSGVDKMMLKYSGKSSFPFKEVIQQWHLRKKASKKFPHLLKNNPHWLFPDAVIIEQATAELIANERFKECKFNNSADLTAGLGIDFYSMLNQSEQSLYVDANETRVQYAKWNFKEKKNVNVVYGKAEVAWRGQSFDLVFLDPDRRSNGKRTFLPDDSTPNLNQLLPEISPFAGEVWVKLSPMVDVVGLRRLYPNAHIRVWSLADEVKEITLHIGNNQSGYAASILSNTGKRFDWFPKDNGSRLLATEVEDFIYYPDAAIRKLQMWDAMCGEYGVKMLDVNTNVFTSNVFLGDFPGKVWKTIHVSKPGDRNLIDVEGMHVLRKNYPQTVAQLRKRYRIREGSTLLLACKVAGKNQWITGESV